MNKIIRDLSLLVIASISCSIGADSIYSKAQMQFIQNSDGYYSAFRWIKFDSNSIVNTHLALITSSSVLAKVVQTLHDAVDTNTIRSKLSVKKVIDTSLGVICIDIVYPKDTFSNDIVNTLCNVYLKWKEEVDLQAIIKGIKVLENKINKNQLKIDSLEHFYRVRYKHNKDENKLTRAEQSIRNRLRTIHMVHQIEKEEHLRLKIVKEAYYPELHLINRAE